ncbi:MAG: hypothetical protein ACR652_05165 [Methylocystis sp.]|uniref:hypothetical protein n=1 Tax=Methylocystis sp. TaxID=1911079 RepID=UPI003DA488F1
MTDSATDSQIFAESNGIAKVFTDTPLAKLNYFDGRYLRADDLQREQRYHEARSKLVALSQGAGPVYGLGVSTTGPAGAPITVEPGLGFNELGDAILLKGAVAFDLAQLIAATASMDAAAKAKITSAMTTFGPCAVADSGPQDTTSATQPVYVITIAPNEALCGREDVYGQLCEAACVQGSAANLAISGVILRARPLNLTLPPVAGSLDLHLRSRLAAAFFRCEAKGRGGLLASGGLHLPGWCGTADAGVANEIALGIALLRNGNWIVLDQWTVRRERMTPLPLGVWLGRLGMRRHEQFLAEVFQFQCQLAETLAGAAATPPAPAPDVCVDLVAKLQLTKEQRDALDKIVAGMQAASAAGPKAGAAPPGWLYANGFVELPPAGFLPVDPASAAPLRQQVAALLGPLVDFRLIGAPADVIPHAFEEARDMRRTPLVADLLQDGETRPQLEVYAPDAVARQTGKDDYRSTHAGAHETTWAMLALMLGLPISQVEKSPLGFADYLPSIMHAGTKGGEGLLALLGAFGRGMWRAETAAPSAGVSAEVVDEMANALLTMTDANVVVGMTCKVAGDVLGGKGKLNYVLTMGSVGQAWTVDVTVEPNFSSSKDTDIGATGPLKDVKAYEGSIAIHSTFHSSPSGSKGAHARVLGHARLWTVRADDNEISAYLITDLWDKSEQVPETSKRAAALAFRKQGDGFIPQSLTLLQRNDDRAAKLLFSEIFNKGLDQPNGAADPFDRSVAGTEFDNLLSSLGKLDPPLSKAVRDGFRVTTPGGSVLTPMRDWVMFRRSRAVIEEAQDAAPVPRREG